MTCTATKSWLSSHVWLTVLFAIVTVTGCGDKVTVNKIVKGGAGESCTRRDDCTPDLECIDNRCVSATGAGAPKQDGGMPLDTRGVAG